jgi:hypothetical protein
MRLKELSKNDAALYVAIEEVGEPTNPETAALYIKMTEGLVHLNGRHERITTLFEEAERVRKQFNILH